MIRDLVKSLTAYVYLIIKFLFHQCQSQALLYPTPAQGSNIHATQGVKVRGNAESRISFFFDGPTYYGRHSDKE